MKNLTSLFTALVLLAAGWRVEAQTTGTYPFNNLNKAVPDGNPAGMSDTRSVVSPVVNISAVQVKLRVAGEFNGDLYGYLRHITPLATNYVVLLNRVGRTAADSAGYDDAGLDVTFAATGGPDIHVYRGTTTVPAGQPLTGTWQPDGRPNDPGGVLDTSPRTTSLANFAGMDANGEWTLFLADLENGGTNMLVSWELDVTGAVTPTVTWSTPGSIVYGTGLGAGQLNAASPASGSFAYSPPAGTVLNAGAQTLTAVFTPDDLVSYVRVTNTVALTVTPAPLAITAVGQTKLYGAALPTLTATYAGFVNGDTAASLSTPPQLATTGTAASPVGTYPITASGAAGANYSISYVPGTLSVTPAALTIAANSLTKLYGAAVPALTATFTGFVNGDTAASLDTPPQLATTGTAASPVGTYPITAAGAASANYSISYAPGTLNVTPAALTIAANNAAKKYGQALPVFTARYEGFVNNDTQTGLGGALAFNTAATPISDAGPYAITPSGLTSLNYAIAFQDGTLTIEQAALTGIVNSSKGLALLGEQVTFSDTLTAVAPGAGAPTGPVHFKIDGSLAGSGTLSGGVASLATASLTPGTHTVVAEYAGDNNFLGVTNTLAPDQVINQAPVAGADTIQRDPTNGVKVSIAFLLSNDSDPDHDPVSFVSVTNTSASGAAVAQRGNWIYYTPKEGVTTADSFTYQISDGRGGTATGTVTVAIKVDNTPAMNLTITDLGSRTYRLRFDGVPFRAYSVLYSDSLQPPAWQPLTNITATGFGLFECTNTVPGGVTQRYYRSTYP